MPHPAPGPGAAPGSIAAARPGPQPVPTIRSRSPGAQVYTLGALEDVAGAEPGEHEPAGAESADGPDDEVAIQQADRDREAHAEGVDRPRALEQQRPIGGEARTSEEPAHPLAPRLGQNRPEHQTARTE